MRYVREGELEFSTDAGGAVTAGTFLHLPFPTKEGNFIIGITGFELSYGNPDIDHHVKNMGISLKATISSNDDSILLLSAKAWLNDASNHHMPVIKSVPDQKDKSPYHILHYAVIAYDKDEQLPKNTVNVIRSITSFDLSYGKDVDHHLRGYEVTRISDSAWMKDGSNHMVKGTATGMNLWVPEKDLQELKDMKIGLICGWYITMKDGDHHVSHTGICKTKNGYEYDLSDKHKQYAETKSCRVLYDV